MFLIKYNAILFKNYLLCLVYLYIANIDIQNFFFFNFMFPDTKLFPKNNLSLYILRITPLHFQKLLHFLSINNCSPYFLSAVCSIVTPDNLSGSNSFLLFVGVILRSVFVALGIPLILSCVLIYLVF